MDHEERRQRFADGNAQEGGEKDNADNRGPLFEGEPQRGEFGKGIQQKRLGNGQTDGKQQRQGKVRGEDAAQQAEDTQQDRAEAHGFLEAPGVDGPGGGDGQRDVDDHEDHRQQADIQIADVEILRRFERDRRVANP